MDGSKFKAVNTRDKNFTAGARSMATSGRGSGIVGYNVQSVVEAEHHLIVAHEVVIAGSGASNSSAEQEGDDVDGRGTASFTRRRPLAEVQNVRAAAAVCQR